MSEQSFVYLECALLFAYSHSHNHDGSEILASTCQLGQLNELHRDLAFESRVDEAEIHPLRRLRYLRERWLDVVWTDGKLEDLSHRAWGSFSTGRRHFETLLWNPKAGDRVMTLGIRRKRDGEEFPREAISGTRAPKQQVKALATTSPLLALAKMRQ